MVAELLEKIENGEIEEDELVSIMTAIGNHQCRKIFDDSVVAGKIYKMMKNYKHLIQQVISWKEIPSSSGFLKV